MTNCRARTRPPEESTSGRGCASIREFDSAALLPASGGMFDRGEALDGHPQIGSKRNSGRIEADEQISLKCGGEKTLRQVFGVFIVFAELHAHEAVTAV